MTKRTWHRILCAALAAVSAQTAAAMLVGRFFTPPTKIADNGYVDVSFPDELCWGKSPQFKRITAGSMLAVLDAAAERHYLPNSVIQDPDGGYRPYEIVWNYWENLPTQTNWRATNFNGAISLWGASSNRNFSTATKIFPRGYDMLDDVRTDIRSLVTDENNLSWILGMSSSWFNPMLGVDVELMSVSNYTERIKEFIANDRLLFTYRHCTEITNTVGRLAESAAFDIAYPSGDIYSWANNALHGHNVSLKNTLRANTPRTDGDLSDGWLYGTNSPIRILASDFSWMNSMLTSADISYVGRDFAPWLRFPTHSNEMTVESNLTAVVSLSNFHLVPESPGVSRHYAMDMKLESVMPPSIGEVRVETNSSLSARWSRTGVSCRTSEIYLSNQTNLTVKMNDLTDAISRAGIDVSTDTNNPTAIRFTQEISADMIFIFVEDSADPRKKEECARIPASQIEQLFLGTYTITNATYSASITTEAPVGNNAAAFQRAGQRWYEKGYSVPSLMPSEGAKGNVRSITVQGAAQLCFEEQVASSNMACTAVLGSGSSADDVDNATWSLYYNRMKPFCVDILRARNDGLLDLNDVGAIHERLRSVLQGSVGDAGIVHFPVMPVFPSSVFVAEVDGTYRFEGLEVDSDGNVVVGMVFGSGAIAGEASLSDFFMELIPNFSCAIEWDFQVMPSK